MVLVIGLQRLPGGFAELDGTGFAAFAEERELATVAIGLNVGPGKGAEFADAGGAGVEDAQEQAVACFGREVDHGVDFTLFQDARGQGVLDGGGFECRADVKAGVAQFVSEGEQTLDGADDALLGVSAQRAERVCERLEIAQGDLGQGLLDDGQQALNIGVIGAPTIGAFAV